MQINSSLLKITTIFLLALLFYRELHASPALPRNESLRQQFNDAHCFFIQEQYREASDGFQSLVGKYPVMEDYVRYYLARSLMEEGKYREAIGHWESLIINNPRSRFVRDAELGVGDCYFELGEFEQANASYGKLSLTNGVKDARRLLYSGLCYEWIRKHKKAGQAYYAVWSFYPETESAAEAERRIGVLQKEKKIAPPSEKIQFRRIRSLTKAHDFPKAITDIKKFLIQFPQNPLSAKVYTQLGSCYRLLRDYPKAINTYRELIKRFNNTDVAAEGYYYLSYIYWNKNMKRNPRPNLWVISSRYQKSKWADKALFLLGRIEENKKSYKKAANAYDELYRKYPHSDRASEGLWRIGWIYYQQGKYDSAAKYLKNAAKVSKGLSLRNSALYWRGRCLEKLEKTKSAVSSYRLVLKNNFRGYYAYLAGKRLDLLQAEPIVSPIPESDPSPVPEDLFRIKSCNSRQWPQRLEKVRELNAMELFPEAVRELLILNKKNCRDRDFWIGLSRLYRLNHDYRRSIRALYKVYHDEMPRPLWQLLYPKNFEDTIVKKAKAYKLDPYLILALMRQESVFDPQAISPANAYGLMQIITSTGKLIAQKLKKNPFSKEMLHDPEINISFGIWYLAKLFREFNGDFILTLAAYNAGEKAAHRWRKKKKEYNDPYHFIENISYPETRHYVKQVLKNYQNYRWLYKGEAGKK